MSGRSGSDNPTGKGKKGGIDRVLGKLHASLDRGEFYEAHQMYRTLAFRYASQNKFGDTHDLLYDGAIRLLDAGEKSSGADLALLFAEKLLEAKTDPSESYINKLEQLFSRLPVACMTTDPNQGPAAVIDRAKFVDASFKWSQAVGITPEEKKRGHPDLHGRFASVLWSEKDFTGARYHFMLSNDGEACASFLVQYQQEKGFKGEVDLFVAQAVLQYLCHEKKTVASDVFSTYTQSHPEIQHQRPPFGLPLLNFIWLLLMAIDLRRIQHFSILVDKYKPSIERDPSYISYLDKIGVIWFGMPPKPKQPAPGGLLANLFQGLLGSDSDEEGEMPSGSDSFSPPTRPSTAARSPAKQMDVETELD